jgi:hypothetical protein
MNAKFIIEIQSVFSASDATLEGLSQRMNGTKE